MVLENSSYLKNQRFSAIKWIYYQNNSLQIPPSEYFGHFQGGGSVQNSDPSGACGGLFKKRYSTFHITVNSIDYIQTYSLHLKMMLLITSIQLFLESDMENIKNKMFLHINTSNNLK